MSGDVATVSKAEVRAMSLKGQRDVDKQKQQEFIMQFLSVTQRKIYVKPSKDFRPSA